MKHDRYDDGIGAALEAAGAEFIPGGVRVRPADRPDSGARFERLRAISLRSAALLQEADPPGDDFPHTDLTGALEQR